MRSMINFSCTPFLHWATFVLSLFAGCKASFGLTKEIYSLGKKIKVIFNIQNGILVYYANYQSGQMVGSSTLGFELSSPFEGGFEMVATLESSFDEWWKPKYREYEKYTRIWRLCCHF